MSQWATMSARDGEKEMEEVSSPWFSENGGHVVDEEEVREEMEEEMAEDLVDAGLL